MEESRALMAQALKEVYTLLMTLLAKEFSSENLENIFKVREEGRGKREGGKGEEKGREAKEEGGKGEKIGREGRGNREGRERKRKEGGRQRKREGREGEGRMLT